MGMFINFDFIERQALNLCRHTVYNTVLISSVLRFQDERVLVAHVPPADAERGGDGPGVRFQKGRKVLPFASKLMKRWRHQKIKMKPRM